MQAYKRNTTILAANLLLGVAAIAGCSEKSGADAQPMADSVGKLKTLAAQIETAYESGAPHSGHDALHDISQVIASLPSQARLAKLSAEDVDTVKKASEDLFAAYQPLDDALHDSSGTVDYADHADAIRSAIAAIEAKLPHGVTPTRSASTPTVHDHEGEHDQHGGHEPEAGGEDHDGAEHQDSDTAEGEVEGESDTIESTP